MSFSFLVFGFNQVSAYGDSKNSVFKLNKFTPFLTNDIRGEIEIQTDSTKIDHIKVAFQKPTNTRSELFSYADKPQNKTPSTSVTIPKDSFQVSSEQSNGTKNLLASFAINTADSDSITLIKTGIYPVSVEFQDKDNALLSTQYTFITYVSSATSTSQAFAEKLNVVPVISYTLNVQEDQLFNSKSELSESGKKLKNDFVALSNAINSLENIETAKTFSLNGQFLDLMALVNSGNKDTINLFNSESPSNQIIADTYLPLNIDELNNVGQISTFSSALTKTRSTLSNNDILAPSRSLITQSVSKKTFNQIKNSGIEKLIVDDRSFDKISLNFKTTKVKHEDSSLNIATYSKDFLNHLNTSNLPNIQANFLDAYTSVIALEAPSNKRALVIPFDISVVNSNTVYSFLNSLRSNPLSKTLTVDEMFNEITPDTKIAGKIEKSDYGFKPKEAITKEEMGDAKKYISAINSMYEANSVDAIIAGSVYYSVLTTSNDDQPIAKKLEELKDLSLNTKNFVSLPEKRTITLTSKENTIPITIKNSTNKQIKVTIRLESDKLAFPDTDEFQVTLKGQNKTIQVPVRSRTSGSFPIKISMLSSDKNVLLATQSVTLRSTSFSGVGLTIMISSFIFLVLWWTTHARKNRKKKPGEVIELRKEKMA